MIKLDRSLLTDIAHDAARRAFVTAIILLALELDAAVTAEGVETTTELDVLRSLGVDTVQGYLLARPSAEPSAWTAWARRDWPAHAGLVPPRRTTPSRSSAPDRTERDRTERDPTEPRPAPSSLDLRLISHPEPTEGRLVRTALRPIAAALVALAGLAGLTTACLAGRGRDARPLGHGGAGGGRADPPGPARRAGRPGARRLDHPLRAPHRPGHRVGDRRRAGPPGGPAAGRGLARGRAAHDRRRRARCRASRRRPGRRRTGCASVCPVRWTPRPAWSCRCACTRSRPRSAPTRSGSGARSRCPVRSGQSGTRWRCGWSGAPYGTWRPVANTHSAADGTYSMRLTPDVPGNWPLRVVRAADGTVAQLPTLDVFRLHQYSVVTRGTVRADMGEFRDSVAATYADPRGWQAAHHRFVRVPVSSGRADFTVVLSQARYLPAFSWTCSSTYSCRVGRFVIINQDRWRRGSPHFPGTLDAVPPDGRQPRDRSLAGARPRLLRRVRPARAGHAAAVQGHARLPGEPLAARAGDPVRLVTRRTGVTVGLLLALVAAAVGVLPAGPAAAAAAPTPGIRLTGGDVSWPNCPRGMGIPSRRSEGHPMPLDSAAFVVVGLTNGPGFVANPCLAAQVGWVQAQHRWLGAYAMTTFPSAAERAAYGGSGPWATPGPDVAAAQHRLPAGAVQRHVDAQPRDHGAVRLGGRRAVPDAPVEPRQGGQPSRRPGCGARLRGQRLPGRASTPTSAAGEPSSVTGASRSTRPGTRSVPSAVACRRRTSAARWRASPAARCWSPSGSTATGTATCPARR